MDSGIVKYSQRLEATPEEAARQVLYDYYRQRDKLTTGLHNYLSECFNNNILLFDEDFGGFTSLGFEPPDLDVLVKLFTENHTLFTEAAEYVNVHKSMSFLGITGPTGEILKHGKALLDKTPNGQPWPMVSIDLIFEFLKTTKPTFDMAQFAAYVGIGSILGVKPYVRSNKQHILARMFGYPTHGQIPEKMNPVVKDLLAKYSTRYWMDKLLIHLELSSWGLKFYSHQMRGIMIGNGKISLEGLIYAAETKKQTAKIRELKNQKREAREKVLQQLNKEKQVNKKDQPNFKESSTNNNPGTALTTARLQQLNKYN